jgi:outer membrane receptor for ferrienterochelin and colicins
MLYNIVFSTFLCFIFSANIASAQTLGRISGQVGDSQEPLPFVMVSLKDSEHKILTDADGKFQFDNLQFDNYQLLVQAIGYEDYSQSIKISPEKPAAQVAITMREPIIVVSGSLRAVSKMESAIAIDVFTAEFFKRNPAPSVFEAMQNVNGVRPQLNCNVCNTGDIHINGLEGPYTMVLIDGMPIVSGLSTVYGLTGIPQALIERVEIVKGPASTLYGSEAVGGLINVITKNLDYAPAFSADVFGSSWGELNSDFGAKFKLGKRAKSLLGVNYFHYQTPIDNNNDGFTDLTLQSRVSVFNKWHFDRKDRREFSIAARYVHENRWGGQMNWTPNLRGSDSLYAETIRTNRWETFGTYQLPTKETIKLQWSGNGHYQDSYYGTTPYKAAQYVAFAQLTWHKSIKKHQILSGLALRYTHYDDNTPATTTASATTLPGIFLQDEWAINSKHTLLSGLRYDYNSRHGNIFSPRLNYRYTSADKLNTFRLGLGNGYRVANVFTEDHAALTGARQVVFLSELLPETSWNVNINFVKKIYTAQNIYIGLDAALFYTYFNNRILPDYESDPNKIIYRNLDGYATSRGATLNIDLVFPFGLKILAGGTLIDVATHENDTRTWQMLTERFSAVWSISYELPKIGLTLDYTANLYSPMRLPLLGALDDRPNMSPWWSLQNIQITKKIGKKMEIYGGIKNFLNFTPPANSIARAHDPFDRQVQFAPNGQVIATAANPNALTFDPSYVFAPNQGIRAFLGLRYLLHK